MRVDDQVEAAGRKSGVIESVALRLDILGTELRPHHRAALKDMKLPELQMLAQRLNSSKTDREGITAVVEAITEAGQTRRAEEERRMDELGVGPVMID